MAEFSAFLEKIDIRPAAFIPVSGMEGDNIAIPSERMPWYSGPTVLAQMDAFEPTPAAEESPLRLPVQGVYKFTGRGDTRRIVAGTVEAGRLRAGDELVFYPSGKRTRAKTLEVFSAPTPEAFSAGMAAGFTMTEEIFARRGELCCRADEEAPHVGMRLRANLFWLGKTPFSPARRYYLKCGTAKVEMRLESVSRVVNASNLDCTERSQVEKNEVAECILRLERPMAFDTAGGCSSTSRFVVVDDYEIAGGGIITEALRDPDYDGRNIRPSADALSGEERQQLTGHRGLVVWLTGLSGSGKSTIANEAERRLLAAGLRVYQLDGDKLRRGLCKDLGFSEADRRENIRRTAEAANLFRDAGLVVLTTLISPMAAARQEAREICGGDFMEVYVKADVAACAKRDPKGLYEKALRGEIPNFTGISAPYEAPLSPELTLDTEALSEEECVSTLCDAVLDRLGKGRHL